jgi:sugar phosphate isomerase/epimerase
MVGGGEGAFIGAVHRSAASLDGDLELVCGAFSSDAGRSRRAGASLHLDPARCYADYREMFASEGKRRVAAESRSHKEEAMDFVVIVTPNHLHYPVAVAALKSGFHVLSDKPATVSLAECKKLKSEIEKSGLLYGLTHPYTSYPLLDDDFANRPEPCTDPPARWAASLGHVGVQVPTSDSKLFDLKRAAESQIYCDEVAGKLAAHGIEISELSTHLQGQLVACHPACVPQFAAFADASVRARPILDAFDVAGVDVCFEIHPGEDLHDGATFERFVDAVDEHPRASILFDPSHLLLQQMDYAAFIDLYHERIKAFHVKGAEFHPYGRAGVYGGYQAWIDRPGRCRSLGDGQIDFTRIFSKLAQYGYQGWAVLEWECVLKRPEDGAGEGAPFIRAHMIRTTDKQFDDFASTGADAKVNRRILGLDGDG